MTKPLHYPVDDDHPNYNHCGTRRPVLCRSTTATFMDIADEKGKSPRGDQRTTQLGSDYDALRQAYYTTDKTEVTCKLCMAKMKRLRDAKGNVVELKARIIKIQNKISTLRAQEAELKELLNPSGE